MSNYCVFFPPPKSHNTNKKYITSHNIFSAEYILPVRIHSLE